MFDELNELFMHPTSSEEISRYQFQMTPVAG